MIAWLLKNWKLFLDILLVVGGIILFSFFDPFGIFSNRTLKSTANILSSVKSIGELVTAEYYGEVISSLHGTQVYHLQPDTLISEFENCFIELKSKIVEDVLIELGDQPRLKGKQQRNLSGTVAKNDYFEVLRNHYKTNNIYNHLIVFVGVNNIRNDISFFYKKQKNRPLKNNAEKDVAKSILDEIFQILENLEREDKEINYSEFRTYIYSNPTYFNHIVDFHYQLNNDNIKKPKHDIVFIGRGWVKAGFKFDKLDKANFNYDSKNKIIRFYGLSPEVLDKDINPWFIPEKKVKGFELVDFYKKATFEEAKAVKLECKKQLLEQAQKADILQQARINGEESLQSFFALLTNEPDLKVEFRNLPYQNELNMISADTLITVNEALLIDSIISAETKKISTALSPDKEHYQQALNIFTNQLQKLSFIQNGVSFNLFIPEAAKILAHKRFITPNDSVAIHKIRQTILEVDIADEKFLTTNYIKNHNYFSTYPIFVDEFNSMLSVLEDEVAKVDAYRSDTILVTLQELHSLKPDTSYFSIDTISYFHNLDSVHYAKVSHKQKTRSFSFNDFKYPVLNVPNEWQDTIRIADTSYVDTLLNTLILETDNSTKSIYYDSLRNDDLSVIRNYKAKKIKKAIKTRPVKRFTSTVNQLFSKK